MWQKTPYTTPLLVTVAIGVVLAFYIWQRHRETAARTAVIVLLAGTGWILLNVFELGSTNLETKIFWSKLMFPAGIILSMGWFIFMLQYTGRDKWLTYRSIVVLNIESVFTLLLVFTNEDHGLIWSSVSLVSKESYVSSQYIHGPWYWVHTIYLYFVVLAGTILLIQMLIRSQRFYRWQVIALLLVVFFPALQHVLYLLGLDLLTRVIVIVLAFPAATIAMAWSIFRFRAGDVVPVAWRAVIDGMSDSVMVLDPQNCIMDVNPSAQYLVGCSASKAMRKPIEDLWPHWSDQITLSRFGTMASEEIVMDQGDEHHIYDVRISPLTDWYGGLISKVVVLRDITERKKAEILLHESEEKFRTIFEHANDEIIYMDKNGTIIDINKKDKDTLFGYSPEEVIGKNFIDLSFAGLDVAEMSNLFQNLVIHSSSMPMTLVELEFKNKKGDTVFAEVSTRLIEKDGEVEGILSIVRDITERKKAEEKIKASLKEKEVLLREIHHRVRNNLQVISSLLSLQSTYIKDDKYTEMLKESQNRIRAMALIHEKLYQSENLAKVDFSEYITALVNGLVCSYGASDITLKIKVNDISLGTDAAIPCGLIINELVSNSLKHAFPGGKGKINVILHTINENIELVVSDNGIGIPENINFRNTESLGLRLVTILAEGQLNGSIDLDRTKGTTFHIRFGRVE
jgi:PAS domain S-box-containing protein